MTVNGVAVMTEMVNKCSIFNPVSGRCAVVQLATSQENTFVQFQRIRHIKSEQNAIRRCVVTARSFLTSINFLQNDVVINEPIVYIILPLHSNIFILHYDM